MSPVLFGTVPAYPAVVIVVSVLVAGHLVRLQLRAGIPPGDATRLLLCVVVLMYVGAAAYSVWERGIRVALFLGPGTWLKLRYPGALVGLALGSLVLPRLVPRHTSLRELGDAAVPALALGFAALRLGCLLAGCCYGEVTDVPWGLRFPAGSPAARMHVTLGLLPRGATESLPVHPLQLYLAALSLAAGAACVWYRRRRAYPGQVMLVFLLVHEGGKGVLEFMRPEIAAGRHLAYAALGMSLVAGVMLAASYVHGRRTARPAAPPTDSTNRPDTRATASR